MSNDGKDITYTVDGLTCHLLAGGQVCEYIVHSSQSASSVIDLCIWGILIFLFQKHLYLYVGLLLIAWIFIKKKSVRQESILAIKDVGIQVRTIYWGGSSVSRFISKNRIEDIIINEGISFWQIKSYMAILVNDEDKMIVVFEHLLPRLRPILLEAYKGTRKIIFSQ
ncbi:GPI-GlcNAc transferase complex, PIG-H component-domain-containing protein [Mycotypha africana]|uniref:GPI-GlcNAc transferase complex, PIG-H component-domain-containing protein n=1 Tax=Mycotypha africana TaxID=64632 RepID=UPI0023003EBB|nr:GPI-GlcNAc transferase complex, PIG-H component-domain-containing protein [Mycotypha africana]KAI8970008.1 GPI-GlcNAc transferase complex, PIG-H component-domain-containing protein [Mycotypha africana]